MEVLSLEEIRVLGCLMEKERTTPEYYPMTLNSLVQACNQKTSRDPVMQLDAEEVEQALEALNARGLANWVHQAGARVRKFRHSAVSTLEIYEPAEQALLTVLLLRGPQTVGELRQRSDRLYPFESLEEVEHCLDELMSREDPLVEKCGREPGRKEIRYRHRLGGEATDSPPSPEAEEAAATPTGGLPAKWEAALKESTHSLEEEIHALRGELKELREAFESFKRQFD